MSPRRDGARPSHLPPALLMGGHMGGALSIARSLGEAGVRVFLLGDPGYTERYSRFVRYISVRPDAPPEEAWAEYLLGPKSEPLHGAVLLACSDAGLELLLRHRRTLSERYVLDISEQQAQEKALNKLETYVQASEAGVPSPRFWHASSLEEVRSARDEFVYPLLLKPLYSHKFTAVYGSKFILVNDYDELCTAFADVMRNGLEVVLLEKIPGPDDLLCSYYTYIDDQGEPQLHFTKRIIRRHPVNEGLGCYHVTARIPAVADLARTLLAHMGLRGLANVEFKRDVRDGQLKVIEVNARFTAANPLLVASGYDLGLYVYNRLIGREQPSLLGQPYKVGLHLWYPENDVKAFLQLRQMGQLDFLEWAGSLLHRQVLPYFRWDDPVPSIMTAADLPVRLARREIRRRLNRPQTP